MKLSIFKAVTLIGALSAGGVAFADSPPQDDSLSDHQGMANHDSDNFSAMMMNGGFEHLDLNGDGTISRAEVVEHHKSMHANANMMMNGGNR